MWDFEHECHFDIKWQENILCKIPSDSNARNIIIYCEFSNAVLGHVIQTFPGMNEKTQSYIFTSGSRRLHTPRPLEIKMETDVLFSYITNASHILTMVCKVLDVPFEWGIYIDMYYQRNFLFNPSTLLRLSWYFLKQDFKQKTFYGCDGWHRSKHVLASRP